MPDTPEPSGAERLLDAPLPAGHRTDTLVLACAVSVFLAVVVVLIVVLLGSGPADDRRAAAATDRLSEHRAFPAPEWVTAGPTSRRADTRVRFPARPVDVAPPVPPFDPVPASTYPRANDPPEPAKEKPPWNPPETRPEKHPPPTEKKPEPKEPPSKPTKPPSKFEGEKPNNVQRQALKNLNSVRTAAGLPPVELDVALCAGCSGHARYLVQNHIAPTGLGIHDEDHSTAGYSEEGEQAGRASVIVGSVGKMAPGWPLCVIDDWPATVYHRIPLLRPDLKRVGFGYAASKTGDLGYVLLDAQSGIEGEAGDEHKTRAVLYPGDKQRGVPCVFGMGVLEVPNPIPANGDAESTGYPVTATFFAGETVEDVVAVLKDGSGREMRVWRSTPQEPARSDASQQNTICLIPKEPLKPGTTYTVKMAAKVDGKPWSQMWSFTTKR
jgi:hypothetical protein